MLDFFFVKRFFCHQNPPILLPHLAHMGRTVPWRPNAAKPWSVGNAKRPCAPPLCWRRRSGRSPCPSSRSSGRNHGGRSARRPEGPRLVGVGLVGWKVPGVWSNFTVIYPTIFCHILFGNLITMSTFSTSQKDHSACMNCPAKLSKRILQHNPLEYSPDPEPNSLGKEFLSLGVKRICLYGRVASRPFGR